MKTPVFRIDAGVERAQIESLRELRAGRDEGAWRARLERLEGAARGTESDAGDSVRRGELCDCGRDFRCAAKSFWGVSGHGVVA